MTHSTDKYILGAGGMAREAYQIYVRLGCESTIKGFLVSAEYNNKNELYSIPVLNENDIIYTSSKIISAIGTPLRKEWIVGLEAKGVKFDTLIDPSSVIGQKVKVGIGSIICSNVSLTCDISIGKHSIINCNVSLHHDVVIGNFVTIGPGTTLAGGVKIGRGSYIGAGTTIIPGIEIGANCYIGAGSTVISNISDSYLAYGSPAKKIRKLNNLDWKKLI